ALIGALPGAPAVELVPIATAGDLQTEVPLWAVAGRAFFTKELDRALLEDRVDLAVHSLKDLPTELEPGLALAAVLEREDPRDALVGRDGRALTVLPAGARVGTSSLRRRAFIARLRPDIQLRELRGNVPTRLERLERGDYDAIVLAAAGLKRLGLESRITERLDPADFSASGLARHDRRVHPRGRCGNRALARAARSRRDAARDGRRTGAAAAHPGGLSGSARRAGAP
ncbi:Tetrapyrrole biosynthesis, hydroxymethylbilane synthase, partial [mine drainage metagenome]